MWLFVLTLSVLKVPFSSDLDNLDWKKSPQQLFVRHFGSLTEQLNSILRKNSVVQKPFEMEPFLEEETLSNICSVNTLSDDKDNRLKLQAQELDEPETNSDSDSKSKKTKRKSIVRRRNLNEEEVQLSTPSGTIIPGIQWETLMKHESREVYEQEQVWKTDTIKRYLDQSERVVVATIIEHRLLNANLGLDLVMEVEVEDYLLGEGDIYLTLDVPYVAPFVPARPETVPPVVVDSYRMLIFIDAHKRVVEGNGMFVLEGEYAWRNKRPDVFLNPRYDRDWSMESPIPDYVMYSMSEVLEAIAQHNEDQPFWRRRRFRGFSFD
ncbi:MAG: hypothetical protein CMK59_06805 [Proteobacteria bacterium]|nr:hypothetical protein [Pseudomonadota bacterium]